MKTMQIHLGGQEEFECGNCLTVLFKFNHLTHYAEKPTHQGLASFLMIQRCQQTQRTISLQADSNELIEKTNPSSKTIICCHNCKRPLGFIKKRVTRQKQDLLNLFIIKTAVLNKSEVCQDIHDFLKDKFSEFLYQENKERRERRRQRQLMMKQLQKSILQIDGSTIIQPYKQIRKKPIVTQGKVEFKLLSNFDVKDTKRQNLLLRNTFTVFRVSSEPTVVVQQNKKSILKKTTKPELQFDGDVRQEVKTKLKCASEYFFKLSLYPVNNFQRFFRLRSTLLSNDLDSMKIMHFLYLHSLINRSTAANLLHKQQIKKQKLSRQALTLKEINDPSLQFDGFQ